MLFQPPISGPHGRLQRQPCVGPSQEPGAEGELKLINLTLSQQTSCQGRTTKHHQASEALPRKGLKGGGPVAQAQAPLKTFGIRRLWWSKQPALQRLPPERQLRRDRGGAAHHHGHRLVGAASRNALGQQIGRVDQASAAVAPQCFSADQAAICPGQGLLKHPAITYPAQLGRTALRGRQSAIEADGQHQAQMGH